MVCFEISRNGTKICTAGIEKEFGVLDAILSWVKRNPVANGSESNVSAHSKEELFLHIGGLDSETKSHLNWSENELELGDTISIKIVNLDHCDTPTSIVKRDPKKELESKIEYYHQLKAELGDLVD